MNLSIVPLGADIAEEVSSRYSLTTGTIDVAELLREPGETDNVGEQHSQDLLATAESRLDAARD